MLQSEKLWKKEISPSDLQESVKIILRMILDTQLMLDIEQDSKTSEESWKNYPKIAKSLWKWSIAQLNLKKPWRKNLNSQEPQNLFKICQESIGTM